MRNLESCLDNGHLHAFAGSRAQIVNGVCPRGEPARAGASTATPGSRLEFFSHRTFSDSVWDPGNTWNVIEGRSALNRGFGFTVVPEPGTAVLVGMGLIGLARRRNQL